MCLVFILFENRSPPLDDVGNSYKGVEFFKKLAKRFNFHTFDGMANQIQTKKFDPRKPFNYRDSVTTAFYAAREGDIFELKRLITSGFDVNTEDYDRRTCLHIAASEGRLGLGFI